jgi:hypothetical protein
MFFKQKAKFNAEIVDFPMSSFSVANVDCFFMTLSNLKHRVFLNKFIKHFYITFFPPLTPSLHNLLESC